MRISDKKIYYFFFYVNIFFLCLISVSIRAQEKIQLKKSDKLTGKVINGKSVREATGNVHIIHGNVTAYCNSAVQYIDENKVELKGNVRIFQDTISLFTSTATYLGNESRAFCEGGVTLKDRSATLRANNGVYYFNENKADFKGSVIIVHPQYKILSDNLTYLRNTEDSYARGNVTVYTDSAIIKAEHIDFLKQQGKTFATKDVSIEKDSTIIYSDTLADYSFEKKSVASGNVKIVSLKNNAVITGSFAENYSEKDYSFIKYDSKLVRVENENDTLFIFSDIIESYRTKPERYIAKGNAEVIRGNFLAKCDTIIFSKTADSTIQNVSMYPHPVVWQDNLQLTGDSVYAILKDNKLSVIYSKKSDNLYASAKSFMLISNKDEYFQKRFDQITGRDIEIKFENDTIKTVDVYKNANSLYFLYEGIKGNGMNIAEGNNMKIFFSDSQKVSKVKIDRNAKGTYVPETKLSDFQLELPGFKLRKDKPVRR